MKKNICLAVWAFVMIIFEAVLNRYIGIGGIYPNLVFVFVICVAILDDDLTRVTVVSLVCGLILDCLCGGKIGINMFSFGIFAVVCSFLAEKFFVSNIFVMAASVVVSSLIIRFMVFVFGFVIFGDVSLNQIFVPLILKYVLYNFCVSIAMYPILKNTIYKKKAYDRR